MSRTRKTYKPYAAARSYVRKLNLKSMKDWIAFSKGIHESGVKRPNDIPSNPWTIYNDALVEQGKKFSINDFIGNKPQRVMAKRSSEVTEVPKRRGRKPSVPSVSNEVSSASTPKRGRKVMKKEATMDANTVANAITENGETSVFTYAKAKAFLKRMHVKTRADFNALIRMQILPQNFPANPAEAFKNHWQGWNEFLGSKSKAIAA